MGNVADNTDAGDISDWGESEAFDEQGYWLEVHTRETMRLIETTRGTIGTGATVPRTYVQAQVQPLFLSALYRIAPTAVAEIYTRESFALLHDAMRAVVDRRMDGDTPTGQEETVKELHEYFHAWQARHNLNAAWIHFAAIDSVVAALATGYPDNPPPDLVEWFPGGLPIYPTTALDVATVHDGLETAPQPVSKNPFTLRVIPTHKQMHQRVCLEMLKHPPIEEDYYAWEDDGDFGTFDPRAETIDAATKRLMPVLEKRLRRALEGVAEDDRTLNGAQLPVTFRKATGFEWLVRYQVLGESRNRIAKADNIDRGQVSRQIQRTAELVGLTLRESPGGPPLKRRSNTHRVR